MAAAGEGGEIQDRILTLCVCREAGCRVQGLPASATALVPQHGSGAVHFSPKGIVKARVPHRSEDQGWWAYPPSERGTLAGVWVHGTPKNAWDGMPARPAALELRVYHNLTKRK